jgi:hypothetical protein
LGIFISHSKHRTAFGAWSLLPQTRQFEGKKNIRKSMIHCILFSKLMGSQPIFQPAF